MTQIPYQHEIHQIELYTNTTYSSTLFDSTLHKWNKTQSEFHSQILYKLTIGIIIEDEQNNIFGCYIKSPITHLSKDSKMKGNNKWDTSIYDPNALIFSFHSNNRFSHTIRCDINMERQETAFRMFDENDDCLFVIGDNDIVIMKEDLKNECFCEQNSFCYGELLRNLLVGKEGNENCFTVKRIVVVQMNEKSEREELEERMKRIENENCELEKLNELIVKYSTENCNETSETTENINEFRFEKKDIMKRIVEIYQLQELIEMKYVSTVFDSAICDWKQYSTTLHDRIFEKSRIAIVIEDEDENIFGCFINAQIDQMMYVENDEWFGGNIVDPKAFIFSLQSNGRSTQPLRFEIEESFSQAAFTLYKQSNDIFFQIGLDITVANELEKWKCWCNQSYIFDYRNMENILVGKIGKEHPFTPKRISVYQMYEDEIQQQIKIQKEQRINEERMKMKEHQETIMKQFKKEIEQIEEWSMRTCETILYDSNYCSNDNDFNDTLFIDHIVKKQSLIFFIELENGMKVGCFINSTIKSSDQFIRDPNAFLFIFDSNENTTNAKYYSIQQHYSNQSIRIFSNKSPYLLQFGNDYEFFIDKNSKQLYYNYGNYLTKEYMTYLTVEAYQAPLWSFDEYENK